MSNNRRKNKNKRDSANTQQKTPDVTLNIEVVAAPEECDPETNNPDNHRHASCKCLMLLGKFAQGTTLADSCLVAFTAVLAVVACRQTEIIHGQLAAQRIEQRGWVKVNLGDTEPEKAVDVVDKKSLNAHIRVENIGITAARQIYVAICFEILEAGQSIKQNTRCSTRPHHQSEIGILFPKDWGSFQSLDDQPFFHPSLKLMGSIPAENILLFKSALTTLTFSAMPIGHSTASLLARVVLLKMKPAPTSPKREAGTTTANKNGLTLRNRWFNLSKWVPHFACDEKSCKRPQHLVAT